MPNTPTVTASLYIEVNVTCPKCDYLIDLLRQSDTYGFDHNEEGLVLSQACPNGSWSEEHENFEVDEVTCSKCKETFNVKGIDW